MTRGQAEGKKKKRGEAKLGSVIKGSLWERGIWNKFCKKKSGNRTFQTGQNIRTTKTQR